MTAAENALGQVAGTPPEGIANDVATVNQVFDAANDALKSVDYDYSALSDADAETVAALTDPEFTTAADNIEAWSKDNCD